MPKILTAFSQHPLRERPLRENRACASPDSRDSERGAADTVIRFIQGRIAGRARYFIPRVIASQPMHRAASPESEGGIGKASDSVKEPTAAATQQARVLPGFSAPSAGTG